MGNFRSPDVAERPQHTGGTEASPNAEIKGLRSIEGYGYTVAAERPGKTGTQALSLSQTAGCGRFGAHPNRLDFLLSEPPCRIDPNGKQFVSLPQPEPYSCAPSMGGGLRAPNALLKPRGGRMR